MDQNITAASPALAPVAAPVAVGRPVGWTPGLASIAILIAILAFLLGSFRASNSDIWLTLATGKLISTGQYQFGVDPFSWASDGAYWANSSWLTAWLAYFIYDNLSPASLVVAKALCILLTAGFVFATRSKDSPLLPALELTALTVLVASPRFLLQTTVVSFASLAFLLYLLARSGFFGALSRDEPAKPGALWQIPLLFLAWSNLDGFFVLGLAVLALATIGLATFAETRAHAKRLGIIFGLAVVACVLNPHFFANFTLPTELAYMFQDVLPSSLTPAGQTVAALNEGDPGFYTIVSPFSSLAITNPNFAYNFAGLAFYLLVLINVVSFIACGFVPGTKTLVARGLVCLSFGLLAAFQFRLIPFYAIVAGPMTVLNLTDYARWSRLPAALPRGGVRFATLTTFVVMLLGVFMAWPGWLNMGLSRFSDDVMFQAARRVDWELQPEPSLKNAALALKENVAAGQVRNVLNFVPEIAHYCAFFAPEVKCGVDLRLSLFAAKSREYAELRNDLWQDAGERVQAKHKPSAHSWPKTMADWNLDVLVMTHQHQTANQKNLELAYVVFLQPRLWKPAIADGQTFAFQYSPNLAWPDDALLARWRREAFGASPEAGWLPDDTPQAPPREPLWLYQYSRGPGVPPLENATATFDFESYRKYSLLWLDPYFVAYQSFHILPAAGNSGSAPGLVLALQAAQDTRFGELVFRHPFNNQPSWFHSVDLGPPALPILVTRDIRRSIAKNPQIASSYGILANSIKQLTMSQDGWWCGGQYSALRQQMRQIEVVAAQRSAVTLAPWNRDYHMNLAGSLITNNSLDAAQIEIAEAVKLMNETPSADPNWLKMREDMERKLKQLDFELKKRRNDFDLKSAGMSELEKFHLAVTAPWRYTDAENRVANDPRGRGLALEGIKILERMNPAGLTDEQKHERIYQLIRLNSFQGKISEAVEIFTKAQKDFGFANPECAAWIAVATGWYKNLDDALATIEGRVAAHAASKSSGVVELVGATLGLNLLGNEPAITRVYHAKVYDFFLVIQNDMYRQPYDLISDYQTLRGCYALERGDVARALTLFETALTNDRPFNDRAIAVRYRDLIRQEKGK